MQHVCPPSSSLIVWSRAQTLRLPLTPKARTKLLTPLSPHHPTARNGSKVTREPRSDLTGLHLQLPFVPNTPMSTYTHLRLVPRQHAGVNAPQGHVWQDKVEHFGSKDLGKEAK